MGVASVESLPRLPPRRTDGHKGDYGRVLIVAGSRGMSGAACLAGVGALRGGAGLVRVAVPESILPTVAAYNPCYLTAGLPEEGGLLASAASVPLARLAEQYDAVAIGPGLGQGPQLGWLVGSIVAQLAQPMVVDADALNALAGEPELRPMTRGPRILTPHPGEFGRLTRTDPQTVQAKRGDMAIDFARRTQAIVVLKGHRTLVTDGRQLYENTTGNPGMASGGTGDVLTGLVAALLGQGLAPFEAAQLGVYLHGLAGDLARDALGEVSLIAADLLDYLPMAFQQHQRS